MAQMIVEMTFSQMKSNEIGCKYNVSNVYSSKCKYVSTQGRKTTCSDFYFITINGVCQKYIEYHRNISHVMEQEIGLFSCKSGKVKSESLVNDMVSDCGPDAEDEYHLKSMLLYHTKYSCAGNKQLPCRDGHSKCFNMSDVCSYKLDIYSHRIPYRTGEHLENCKEFECNKMFKCPGHYCVPWNYLCDAKWDCSKGIDESNSCYSARNCINMFKCQHSLIWIHIAEVCDNAIHCPCEEDGLLCSLPNTKCPSV